MANLLMIKLWQIQRMKRYAVSYKPPEPNDQLVSNRNKLANCSPINKEGKIKTLAWKYFFLESLYTWKSIIHFSPLWNCSHIFHLKYMLFSLNLYNKFSVARFLWNNSAIQHSVELFRIARKQGRLLSLCQKCSHSVLCSWLGLVSESQIFKKRKNSGLPDLRRVSNDVHLWASSKLYVISAYS